VPADQHRDEPGGVRGGALCAAGEAVDLDAGRVDDEVGDAAMRQVAMEPEAVAPGLVAAQDRRRRPARGGGPG